MRRASRDGEIVETLAITDDDRTQFLPGLVGATSVTVIPDTADMVPDVTHVDVEEVPSVMPHRERTVVEK